MSELPEGVEPAAVPEPKPSALGIVLRDGPARGTEILFGLRAPRSRFLPNHLAFPGGRLDPGDGSPDDAGFRACATREFVEETGLAIPTASWRDAGERTTPPFFPIRFRTKFWVAPLPEGQALPAELPAPDEITAISFESPGSILAKWEGGEVQLPPPVVPILRLLSGRERWGAEDAASAIRDLNAAEDPCPRIEFVPGIWVVPVKTATMPPATHTNVWLIGGDRFAIVDPGSDEPEEIERTLAIVRRRAEEGARAAAVLLTHHHRDHVRGSGALAEALGVPVRAHRATLGRLPRMAHDFPVQPIEDGEILELGGESWTAIHTPGHAPGHLAFHEPGRNALVAGDLVSGLSTILVGLDGGDMGTFLETLRRMDLLGVRHVLPSHGPPLPGIAFAKALEHRMVRRERVLAALGDGTTPLAACAREAYADTPQAPAVLREAQTRAILEHLERTGRVARADADGTKWRRG
jgi:glyoxylase-like metal-dependent hydrolase (beta-lactamase superfamily II)/8-oxo-dGTP pyrophosphatase MutT (NUDIX family)